MESKRKFTRREFLKISAITAAGALAACNPPVPTASRKHRQRRPRCRQVRPFPRSSRSYLPGAAYAGRPVEQGKLPPVVERLPENPWVAPVLEANGKSGGVVRRGFTGPGDKWGMSKICDRALVWFDKDLVMQPRMAESWKSTTTARNGRSTCARAPSGLMA